MNIRKLDRNYTDTWITRREQLIIGGFKSYEEYLKSDVWKEVKSRAVERAHFQECYLCGSRFGIELHHTSYKWIAAGPKMNLRNIRAMCRSHHKEIHELAKSTNISVRKATTLIIKSWMKSGKLLSWQRRSLSQQLNRTDWAKRDKLRLRASLKASALRLSLTSAARPTQTKGKL